MSLKEGKLILLSNNDDKSTEKIFTTNRKAFRIGYYMSCDFVHDHPKSKGIHCEIECDAFGRITIKNFSKDHPIIVNNNIIKSKRPLLNGSIIKVLDKEFRWSYPKKKIAFEEPKTPRKEMNIIPEQAPLSEPSLKGIKRRFQNRLTVHSFAHNIESIIDQEDEKIVDKENITQSTDKFQKIDVKSGDRSSLERNILKDFCGKIDEECFTSSSSSASKQKKTIEICQRSDMVITSFSPSSLINKANNRSFATVTPMKNSPKSVYGTPKSVLSEHNDNYDKSGILNNSSTPFNKGNSSMHLIDFTSERKIIRSPVARTPKSKIPASPYLKSALKNSVRSTAKSVKKLQIQFMLGKEEIDNHSVSSKNDSTIISSPSKLNVKDTTEHISLDSTMDSVINLDQTSSKYSSVIDISANDSQNTSKKNETAKETIKEANDNKVDSIVVKDASNELSKNYNKSPFRRTIRRSASLNLTPKRFLTTSTPLIGLKHNFKANKNSPILTPKKCAYLKENNCVKTPRITSTVKTPVKTFQQALKTSCKKQEVPFPLERGSTFIIEKNIYKSEETSSNDKKTNVEPPIKENETTKTKEHSDTQENNDNFSKNSLPIEDDLKKNIQDSPNICEERKSIENEIVNVRELAEATDTTSPENKRNTSTFHDAREEFAGILSKKDVMEEGQQDLKDMNTPPKEKLMDLKGLKDIFRTPRRINSPQCEGIRNLLKTPKNNNLEEKNLSGLGDIFKTPIGDRTAALQEASASNHTESTKLKITPFTLEANDEVKEDLFTSLKTLKDISSRNLNKEVSFEESFNQISQNSSVKSYSNSRKDRKSCTISANRSYSRELPKTDIEQWVETVNTLTLKSIPVEKISEIELIESRETHNISNCKGRETIDIFNTSIVSGVEPLEEESKASSETSCQPLKYSEDEDTDSARKDGTFTFDVDDSKTETVSGSDLKEDKCKFEKIENEMSTRFTEDSILLKKSGQPFTTQEITITETDTQALNADTQKNEVVDFNLKVSNLQQELETEFENFNEDSLLVTKKGQSFSLPTADKESIKKLKRKTLHSKKLENESIHFDVAEAKQQREMEIAFENFNEDSPLVDKKGQSFFLPQKDIESTKNLKRKTLNANMEDESVHFDVEEAKQQREMEILFENFNEDSPLVDKKGQSFVLPQKDTKSTKNLKRKTLNADMEDESVHFDLEEAKQQREMEIAFRNFNEDSPLVDKKGQSFVLPQKDTKSTKNLKRKTLNADMEDESVHFDLEEAKQQREMEIAFRNFNEDSPLVDKKGQSFVLPQKDTKSTKNLKRKTLNADMDDQSVHFDLEEAKQQREMEILFENFNEDSPLVDKKGQSFVLPQKDTESTKNLKRKTLNAYMEDESVHFDVEEAKQQREMEILFENFNEDSPLVDKKGQSFVLPQKDTEFTKNLKRKTLNAYMEDENVHFDLEEAKQQREMEIAFRNFNEDSPLVDKKAQSFFLPQKDTESTKNLKRKTLNAYMEDKNVHFNLEEAKQQREMEIAFENFNENSPLLDKKGQSFVLPPKDPIFTRNLKRKTFNLNKLNDETLYFDVDEAKQQREMEIAFENFNEDSPLIDKKGQSFVLSDKDTKSTTNLKRRTLNFNTLKDETLYFDLEEAKQQREMEIAFENFNEDSPLVDKKGQSFVLPPKDTDSTKNLKRKTLNADMEDESLHFDVEEAKQQREMEIAFENFNEDSSLVDKKGQSFFLPQKDIESTKNLKRKTLNANMKDESVHFDVEEAKQQREMEILFENFNEHSPLVDKKGHSFVLPQKDTESTKNLKRKTLNVDMEDENVHFDLEEAKQQREMEIKVQSLCNTIEQSENTSAVILDNKATEHSYLQKSNIKVNENFETSEGKKTVENENLIYSGISSKAATELLKTNDISLMEYQNNSVLLTSMRAQTDSPAHRTRSKRNISLKDSVSDTVFKAAKKNETFSKKTSVKMQSKRKRKNEIEIVEKDLEGEEIIVEKTNDKETNNFEGKENLKKTKVTRNICSGKHQAKGKSAEKDVVADSNEIYIKDRENEKSFRNDNSETEKLVSEIEKLKGEDDVEKALPEQNHEIKQKRVGRKKKMQEIICGKEIVNEIQPAEKKAKSTNENDNVSGRVTRTRRGKVISENISRNELISDELETKDKNRGNLENENSSPRSLQFSIAKEYEQEQNVEESIKESKSGNVENSRLDENTVKARKTRGRKAATAKTSRLTKPLNDTKEEPNVINFEDLSKKTNNVNKDQDIDENEITEELKEKNEKIETRTRGRGGKKTVKFNETHIKEKFATISHADEEKLSNWQHHNSSNLEKENSVHMISASLLKENNEASTEELSKQKKQKEEVKENNKEMEKKIRRRKNSTVDVIEKEIGTPQESNPLVKVEPIMESTKEGYKEESSNKAPRQRRKRQNLKSPQKNELELKALEPEPECVEEKEKQVEELIKAKPKNEKPVTRKGRSKKSSIQNNPEDESKTEDNEITEVVAKKKNEKKIIRNKSKKEENEINPVNSTETTIKQEVQISEENKNSTVITKKEDMNIKVDFKTPVKAAPRARRRLRSNSVLIEPDDTEEFGNGDGIEVSKKIVNAADIPVSAKRSRRLASLSEPIEVESQDKNKVEKISDKIKISLKPEKDENIPAPAKRSRRLASVNTSDAILGGVGQTGNTKSTEEKKSSPSTKQKRKLIKGSTDSSEGKNEEELDKKKPVTRSTRRRKGQD